MNAKLKKITTAIFILLALYGQQTIAENDTYRNDQLYVGDVSLTFFGANDKVNVFNADTGQFVKSLVINKDGCNAVTSNLTLPPKLPCLFGVRGMVVNKNELIVSNQNPGQPFNGDVLRYNLKNGNFKGYAVPRTYAQAPFAPRGLVINEGIAYVADQEADKGKELIAYKSSNGQFVGYGQLDTCSNQVKEFHPRGIVFGPDGLLYVSSFLSIPPKDGGQVLQFDPNTMKCKKVLVDDVGGPEKLNRPEGLVFGPDHNLYITSFRSSFPAIDPNNPDLSANIQCDPTDADAIRIYSESGQYIDKIDLCKAGEPRVYAQALLFGPQGKLFVPVSGGNGYHAGEVRSYDVDKKKFKIFVDAGIMGKRDSVLVTQPNFCTQPIARIVDGGGGWYLTFGKTNSATLAYEGW